MKSLNPSATKVFKRLIEGVTFDRMAKFNNAPGCYMPVSVERINETPYGFIYSVTHYGEQNRDLMCDPDMTFLVSFANEEVYPLTYRNDYVGVDQMAVDMLESDPAKWRVAPKLQAGITSFANTWMRNIREQQRLDVEGVSVGENEGVEE